MNIATHNGQFHADEVSACMMLTLIFPESTVLRTRDPQLIESSDIVVDVGQVYNPELDRFDHHQKGCNEFLDGDKIIPMSSAGMVYKKYGKRFLKIVLDDLNDSDVDALYQKFYYHFIQEIDAIDNGVKQSDTQKYIVSTNLSSIINKLNETDDIHGKKQDASFKKGMVYAYDNALIILKFLHKKHQTMTGDYETVCEAFKNRDENKQVLVMHKDCPNWQKCIVQYENNHGLDDTNNIKFVIYESNSEWRIRAISFNFVPRTDLLPMDILKQFVKCPNDIIFVHNGGFIASCKTLDTAIEICKLSINVV